jgi:hypothetical protein
MGRFGQAGCGFNMGQHRQFLRHHHERADPQSAYRKERKTIYIDADTVFEAIAKEDLMIGQGVQVVGLDLKEGKVQASRLTVYEGKRPVRMPKDAKVLTATGPRH